MRALSRLAVAPSRPASLRFSARSAGHSPIRTSGVLPTLVLATLALPAAASTAQDLSRLSVETIATRLDSATVVTHAGDDRLFVALRSGRIEILRNGVVLPAPFLDLTERVLSGGEEGFLGLAFPPDHGATGVFYADYVGKDGTLRLSRFSLAAPDRADPDSETVLLEIPQPAPGHYGGSLQFAPDGTLYLSTGDGVGTMPDPTCRAQSLDSLLGKVLRLDVSSPVAPGGPPTYTVPPSNPFFDDPDARPEIWALGLRNPWRLAFDRETGDLYVPDVGLGAREEINVRPASSPGGENFGWKVQEGTLCRNDTSGCAAEPPPCGSSAYTDPRIEYAHDEGCAVIGGVAYRGEAIPDLEGAYLFGDHCRGTLWAAREEDGWERRALTPELRGLTTIGEDVDGEVYLAAAGALFKLVDPSASTDPGRLAFPTVRFDEVERAGAATIEVARTGGSRGEVSVRYATAGGTAVPGVDYLAVSGTLQWASGDTTPKAFEVPLLDDSTAGPDLTVGLALSSPTGGARVPSPAIAVLGASFPARWVRVSEDAAYFWFFQEPNPEVFVKLIDACVEPFQHFWMYASGLTDVEVTLAVLDTQTGVERTYVSPPGQAFLPIQDVGTFDTCP